MAPVLTPLQALRWQGVSRFRAGAIHLGISALIATAALVLLLVYWYPPPLFAAMGGTELVVLVVGVDVCIGPLITLIIFDTRKKELLFDLAIVATLQLAALGYGIYAMHAGRPVFIVFAENRFVVVSAAELETEAIEKAARPEFRTLSLTGPVWVVADMPTDSKELTDLAFAQLAGLGVQNLPQHYVPYAERRDQVLAHSLPLEMPADLPEGGVSAIDAVLARSGHGREDVRYLSAATKRAMLTALIDGKTGDVLGLAAVDPRTLSAAKRSNVNTGDA
jgi:hypothetical protein